MDNNYTERDIRHTVPTLDSLTADDVQSFADLIRLNTERITVRERERQLYGTWSVEEPEVISNTNDLINHISTVIRDQIYTETINNTLESNYNDYNHYSEWTPAAGFNRGLINKKKRKLDLRLNDDLFKME